MFGKRVFYLVVLIAFGLLFILMNMSGIVSFLSSKYDDILYGISVILFVWIGYESLR